MIGGAASRKSFLGVLALGFGALAAAVVMRSGGAAHAASQVEAGLGLARRLGAESWLSLALLQLLATTVGIFPAALVGMAAGAICGIAYGFVISGACVLLGALIAFAFSRSLFRPLILRAMRNRIAAGNFDVAIGREGWKFVLLLRVSPLMPFAATSYLLGLSSVSARDYMFGTLASLPALFGYVTLGALADRGLADAAGAAGPLQWAMLCVGFAASALAVVHVGGLLRRAANAGGDDVQGAMPKNGGRLLAETPRSRGF